MDRQSDPWCAAVASPVRKPASQGVNIPGSMSTQNVQSGAGFEDNWEVPASSSLPSHFDYVSHIYDWERREGIAPDPPTDEEGDDDDDDDDVDPIDITTIDTEKVPEKFCVTKVSKESVNSDSVAKGRFSVVKVSNDSLTSSIQLSSSPSKVREYTAADEEEDDVFVSNLGTSVTMGGKFVVTTVDGDFQTPSIPLPASILSSARGVVGIKIPSPPHTKKTVMFGEPSTYKTVTIETVQDPESSRRESMGSASDEYDTIGSTCSTSSLLRKAIQDKKAESGAPVVGIPGQDLYYDTASSTSSTATLLRKEVTEHREEAAAQLAREQAEKLAASEYMDLVQSGQNGSGHFLLAKTLEQVKKSLEDLSPTFVKEEQRKEDERITKVKNTYLKNLIILSIGFMLPYTAFFSLRNMQSSMNHEKGLGLISMSVMYVMFVIGCIFATSIVQQMRPKYAIVSSMFGQLLFAVANFYPTFYTLVPATGILGFSMAITWTAQGTYITSIAVTYAAATGKNHTSILGLFNGFFLFLIQTAQILGNLISSSVFNMEMSLFKEDMAHSHDLNGTEISVPLPEVDPSICGALYCHSYSINHATVSVQKHMVYILLGVFASLILIGIVILGFCLSKLDVIFRKNRKTGLSRKLLALFHIHKDTKMLLLLPFMTYIGLEEAYMFGEFTKAFITCPLGMHMIGYVMMCFGACNAISSFTFGCLQKYIHRSVMMAIGAIMNMTLLVIMYLWMPTAEQSHFIFILAGAWGAADGAWQTQSCNICGLLFPKEREAAFASLRMYESFGFVIAFAYAQFICMDIKIAITGGALVFSFVSYLFMEVVYKRENIPIISQKSVDYV